MTKDDETSTSQGSTSPANDDLVFEDEAEEGNPGATIKKLRERLRVCEQERQEYLDGWQRAKADFVNARKDEERERHEFRKYAKVDLLHEIIPIADTFERAMANKETWEKVDANWRLGVEYIYSQLQAVLKNHGLSEIGKVGERFDARIHQAVASITVTDKNDDETVREITEKGYLFHDRVVRPAKVTIGHFSAKENSV